MKLINEQIVLTDTTGWNGPFTLADVQAVDNTKFDIGVRNKSDGTKDYWTRKKSTSKPVLKPKDEPKKDEPKKEEPKKDEPKVVSIYDSNFDQNIVAAATGTTFLLSINANAVE